MNEFNLLILGAGGIANAIAPSLLTTMKNFSSMEQVNIHWADGDNYETGNIPRQHLAATFAGKNKAESMKEAFGGIMDIIPIPRFIKSSKDIDFQPNIILGMVDNNAARATGRDIAADSYCPFIWGANEQEEGQALHYRPDYEGTYLDPFVRYPDLNDLTPNEGPACTATTMLERNPQLPVANLNAGSLLCWMLWSILSPNTPPDDQPQYLPAEANFNRNVSNSMTFAHIIQAMDDGEEKTNLLENHGMK